MLNSSILIRGGIGKLVNCKLVNYSKLGRRADEHEFGLRASAGAVIDAPTEHLRMRIED